MGVVYFPFFLFFFFVLGIFLSFLCLRRVYRGQTNQHKLFFVQSFSRTLLVMDVRAENRGRPRQKVHFSAALVMGRNFFNPGHPGIRVRNVRGKSGPKSVCLCCFFFPEFSGVLSGTGDSQRDSRESIRANHSQLKSLFL